MERITNYLVGVVVVALLASIASLMTAKKTEGLVATAVQVVNTPLAVNSEGVKTPYAVTFQAGSSTVVPAGQRFVIESVSGWLHRVQRESRLSMAGGEREHRRHLHQNRSHALLPGLLFTAGLPPDSIRVFNDTNKIYADPGSTVYFNAFSFANPDPDGCPVTLSGYLINP
jgi:hypothetical protein